MTSGDDGAPSSQLSRLLLVEDVVADAELIMAELRRVGVAFTSQRVQNAAELSQALQHVVPDVVLSDHSLPQFGGMEALRVVQRDRPGTPFIVVTGSLDEETAAEYIKAGAVDYVVKQRLFRLGNAVRRALALRRAVEDATRAEAARVRSELRFRKLVEYSSDVITLLDAEGRIVYSTQALKPTLGYEHGELTGQTVFELVHPDDRPSAVALFGAALASGETIVHGALRVRHKDGSWRDLEIVGANHLGDSAVEAVVVNYRDVTDRKRAEAALRELEERHRQTQKMEAIGRLASGVAHDFNNVLTVITTCCELLLEQAAPDASARPDLLEIHTAAERGAALTHQLLAFSRQQPITPQRVDVNALVANMTGMLRRLLRAEVRLQYTPSPGVGPVWADPGRLEQVLMNLAVNARDAMPQGGQLTISVGEVNLRREPAGPYIVLAVSDTGTGMDAETKAHLFEPFFTTKAKGEGTGLGLATVYGIVQQAGGFVEVDSELGTGSTFRVYLPRTTA